MFGHLIAANAANSWSSPFTIDGSKKTKQKESGSSLSDSLVSGGLIASQAALLLAISQAEGFGALIAGLESLQTFLIASCSTPALVLVGTVMVAAYVGPMLYNTFNWYNNTIGQLTDWANRFAGGFISSVDEYSDEFYAQVDHTYDVLLSTVRPDYLASMGFAVDDKGKFHHKEAEDFFARGQLTIANITKYCDKVDPKGRLSLAFHSIIAALPKKAVEITGQQDAAMQLIKLMKQAESVLLSMHSLAAHIDMTPLEKILFAGTHSQMTTEVYIEKMVNNIKEHAAILAQDVDNNIEIPILAAGCDMLASLLEKSIAQASALKGLQGAEKTEQEQMIDQLQQAIKGVKILRKIVTRSWLNLPGALFRGELPFIDQDQARDLALRVNMQTLVCLTLVGIVLGTILVIPLAVIYIFVKISSLLLKQDAKKAVSALEQADAIQFATFVLAVITRIQSVYHFLKPVMTLINYLSLNHVKNKTTAKTITLVAGRVEDTFKLTPGMLIDKTSTTLIDDEAERNRMKALHRDMRIAYLGQEVLSMDAGIACAQELLGIAGYNKDARLAEETQNRVSDCINKLPKDLFSVNERVILHLTILIPTDYLMEQEKIALHKLKVFSEGRLPQQQLLKNQLDQLFEEREKSLAQYHQVQLVE